MSAIHETTGSYALDALDAPELAEFEAHLASCPTCRREVAMFNETAAELSLLTQVMPPAALRDRILFTIRNTPQRQQRRRNSVLIGLLAALLALLAGIGGAVYTLVQHRREHVVSSGSAPGSSPQDVTGVLDAGEV